VSIEELLAQVRSQDPKVGYATVYRTLKLLTECGVAFERRFGDGLARYELADEASHHDHLICVDCGTIVEFEEDRIEVLQEAVAEKYGYELRSHKHEMYGVCPDCQRKAKKKN
jgi:Fur family ferric uptake transcriptional regulator